MTIDKEYTGKEALIKSLIIDYLSIIQGKDSQRELEFGYVGKLSKAHELAYLVYKKKKKEDYILPSRLVATIILGNKKDRAFLWRNRRLLKRRTGYRRIGSRPDR